MKKRKKPLSRRAVRLEEHLRFKFKWHTHNGDEEYDETIAQLEEALKYALRKPRR